MPCVSSLTLGRQGREARDSYTFVYLDRCIIMVNKNGGVQYDIVRYLR